MKKHNIDLSFQTPQKHDIIDAFLDKILLNDINYGSFSFGNKMDSSDVGVQTHGDDNIVFEIESLMNE